MKPRFSLWMVSEPNDTISRNAMFQGLADMVDGDKLIPFIRQFFDSPSTFFWEDELGEALKVVQGEGGE